MLTTEELEQRVRALEDDMRLLKRWVIEAIRDAESRRAEGLLARLKAALRDRPADKPAPSTSA